MHRDFTLRQLSPGGSADLLAAALLVHDLRRGAMSR
jgi:triphosphoribosyl-dephospho-CoA synthetase